MTCEEEEEVLTTLVVPECHNTKEYVLDPYSTHTPVPNLNKDPDPDCLLTLPDTFNKFFTTGESLKKWRLGKK